ncbi:aldo/keto reductase [Amycolatopsis sp. WAC 01375]|uniref:aldo/keto reductase n=1 Tax=unclassified Amycolatopsis TaxID=2618356 RepID=UPI000F76B3D8|nr:MULTISPECIES: aldo/keto reductase [unclassified Amycolatopsis]RSM76319.1 aldo/keto reductase [Amycolatopsis sp. WAC 01375]RSN33461.1 aldo/keto reductase [Amycolatopsis sp. WAC 01416]
MKIPLSPLGLGCAQLGNLYHAIADETAEATVRQAWDEGIRYFDTAPHYGLGLSERRLGAALSAYDRPDFVVSTKVGRVLEPDPAGASRTDSQGFVVPAAYKRRWDFSRDGILRSLEDSLERLGLDRVDVVYVHDPDEHFEDTVGGAFPALLELREQGVVDAIGAGMNQAPMLTEFVRRFDLDVILLAGRYTLLNQPALDDLLPLCAERGVDVVAGGAFNAGILATASPGTMYDYAEAPAELVERAQRIADVCARHGVELPQAALALPAAHPSVVSVVVGAHDPGQVRLNAERFRRPVPRELWTDLIRAGLLREDTVLRQEERA